MRCNILNGICISLPKLKVQHFWCRLIVISTFYFSLHNIEWNYRKEIIYILIWRNVKRIKSPKYKKSLIKLIFESLIRNKPDTEKIRLNIFLTEFRYYGCVRYLFHNFEFHWHYTIFLWEYIFPPQYINKHIVEETFANQCQNSIIHISGKLTSSMLVFAIHFPLFFSVQFLISHRDQNVTLTN